MTPRVAHTCPSVAEWGTRTQWGTRTCPPPSGAHVLVSQDHLGQYVRLEVQVRPEAVGLAV